MKGGEVDEYKAENPSAIKEWLIPLELVNKKACYVNKRNNLADRLSKKFVHHNKERTVLVRYFMLIDSVRKWAMDLKDRQYRFENHLDGHGVKSLWRREDRRPEEILWLHLKYMYHFVERMTNFESTRMYMSFAGTSKILILQPCHDDVILNHANTFAIEPEYKGPRHEQKGAGAYEYYSGSNCSNSAASSGDEPRKAKGRREQASPPVHAESENN